MKHEGKTAATTDARTKGWQSARDLVNGALAPCPLCGVLGPKDRVVEHIKADHVEPTTPSHGFPVSIPSPCRELLERWKAETGWSLGHLIEAAVLRTWKT